MKWREFIVGLSGAAVAQPTMKRVGVLIGASETTLSLVRVSLLSSRRLRHWDGSRDTMSKSTIAGASRPTSFEKTRQNLSRSRPSADRQGEAVREAKITRLNEKITTLRQEIQRLNALNVRCCRPKTSRSRCSLDGHKWPGQRDGRLQCAKRRRYQASSHCCR
jgi:uncharacterized small protein (DUF1192 family)